MVGSWHHRRVVGTRPLVAGIVGWLAGAGASVAVGLLALSAVGADLIGDGTQPFAVEGVTQLDQATSTSVPDHPRPSATGSPPSTTASGDQPKQWRLDSAGGYVVARCRAGEAHLVYWSPAPGFRADDIERGPARTARVTFKGEGAEVKMRVACANGEPRADVEQESDDDDHT
jgi:hypothetical protein